VELAEAVSSAAMGQGNVQVAFENTVVQVEVFRVTHITPVALPQGVSHSLMVSALMAEICKGMPPPTCTVTWAGQSIRRRLQSSSYTVTEMLDVNSSVPLRSMLVNFTNVASVLDVSNDAFELALGNSSAEIVVTVVSQGSAASAEAAQILSAQDTMPIALVSALNVSSSQIIVVSYPTVITPPRPPPALPPLLPPPSSFFWESSSPPWPSLPPPLSLQMQEATASTEGGMAIIAGVGAGGFLIAALAIGWCLQRRRVVKRLSHAKAVTKPHSVTEDKGTTSSSAEGACTALPPVPPRSRASTDLPLPGALPEHEGQSLSEHSKVANDSKGNLVTGRTRKHGNRRSHLDLDDDDEISPDMLPGCKSGSRLGIHVSAESYRGRRGSMEAPETHRRRGSVEAPTKVTSRRGSVEAPTRLTSKASASMHATTEPQSGTAQPLHQAPIGAEALPESVGDEGSRAIVITSACQHTSANDESAGSSKDVGTGIGTVISSGVASIGELRGPSMSTIKDARARAQVRI